MGNPKIRFQGFTDAWEQRKFSDFTWNAGKRNKENLDLVPYAITNEHGFIPQNEAHDEFGYMKDTDRRAYNIVEPNSFAYNPARINVGSLGYYEGAENVIVSSLYEVFKTAEYVDDRFLWHWLKSPELPKWIEKLQEGSVRLYFYYDKLCECILRMPSVEEQKMISQYLDNLDYLITLHQRKCDETKKLKKYMLQKMFPQDGSDVPEIRFAGFTDAWEQRKAGELYKERSERGNDSLRILSVSIHHGVSSGELDSEELGKFVKRSDDKSLYKHVYYGDLVFNMMRAWQGALGVAKSEGMVSPAYITAIPSDDVYPEFMDYCMRRNEVVSQINNLSYGVTDFRKRLYWDSFVKVKLDLPSVEEQKRITETFKSLDHLITLHQRKLAELQNIRKYMLENMFA